MAVRLFAQIERRFGKRLPLSTLFSAPTVRELAAIIEADWTPGWSSLVPIQPRGSKLPFFCIHALGGNVLEYYELARLLGPDQPFYGLQSRALDGQSAPQATIEEMAAHYLKEIRELQPSGPYHLSGRSLGGMIAFEMAQQLKAQGESVGLLALLDTYPSGYAKLLRENGQDRTRIRWRLRAHAANLRSLSARNKLTYLSGKLKFAPRKIKAAAWRQLYRGYQKVGHPLPKALRDIKEFNSIAVRTYVPKVYDGPVTLFWASEDLRASSDFVEGWRALAGGSIEIHEIPGSHLDIIKAPHVNELASKLTTSLMTAQNATLSI
jgi:thioesterase domain-containing protein